MAFKSIVRMVQCVGVLRSTLHSSSSALVSVVEKMLVHAAISHADQVGDISSRSPKIAVYTTMQGQRNCAQGYLQSQYDLVD